MLLKAFRMTRLVANIENVENVHLSTHIKPKVSLKTHAQWGIRNNEKRNEL